MTEKTLATFKIETEQWKAFQAKAGNASGILKEFITAYLEDKISIQPDGSIDTLAGLDEKIEAVLDRVMTGRLNEVRDELGKFTASLAA